MLAKGIKICLLLPFIAGLIIVLFSVANGLVTERRMSQQTEAFIAKTELLPAFKEAEQSTSKIAELLYHELLNAM